MTLSLPLTRVALLLTFAVPAHAVEPEIQRGEATPQADGVRHTVRTIPEACRRLEGEFTGEADTPYRLQAVQTHPRCMRRAELFLADEAPERPSAEAGWALNDRIRIPRLGCPAQIAEIEVWRFNRPPRPPGIYGADDLQGIQAPITFVVLLSVGPDCE